ncbi:NitT/TauT family transport system substrate-binding protein [Mobilisporobacter senegalensis]|uniref:NitT/TauT family transport system substrate-binding protein n=1 Tax=Mobilisporobacter senegalensis TaxID=1329262 RepID=A0A3N1XTF5_9FIRM|nr:ABC transporter substrate-binding protein [Mobilisporobacter senegalensis]ROR28147.1 NitT/TauT family transport system substrate-binding protein [Mobilisporobacter senegalensis]
MKRRLLAVLMVAILLIPMLSGCKKETGLTKITLNEVAHSVFYAPQYVALELGYFKDEGLDVELVTGFGADKTMTAVLSGDADIGFMGSEASIYVYNEGAEDYVVNFAQLTQRAGNFLVSRDTNEDFKWENLKGKTVIGGRAGGMPQMVLEYILKKKNFDIKKDLTIIQNIDFGVTGEAFTSGTGDYTVEFEPTATAIEKSGKGKVVASLGIESGMVPYTSYAAKKSYIEKNGDIIQKFTNAIQKGIEYVNKHTPEEITKVIAPQFPEMDQKDLVIIVTRYYDQQTWKENAVFEEESLTLLLNIIEEAGEISKRPPYEEIITTKFAKEAVK